ncbi:hypothetical protein GCM10027035_40150 [Emticicia sediminis]
MKQLIFVGLIACLWSCKDSSTHLSSNPQNAAIGYCQLANEGIKGDTAKYNVYRKGYLQDEITQQDIFGAMLIYSTAKITRKGTVASFKNVGEEVIKKDASGQKLEVLEKTLFTFENSQMDTVVVKLVYDRNIWRLKCQEMAILKEK